MRLSNWNKTEQSHPKNIFTPKTKEEIAQILQQAREQKKRIRVVGPTRHTWGDISMSDDWVIDMGYFNKILSIDTAGKTVTVQSGCVLHTLFRRLAQENLSVQNMGGIDAQCVAGAVATGTHGSSIHHGTFADDVLGMRIMLANGTILEVNKKDSDFEALRVNLGALGVVLDLTIQCTDLFYVRVQTEEGDMRWSELTSDRILPLIHKYYFFQATLDPYTENMLFYKRQKVAASALTKRQKQIIIPLLSLLQKIKELISVCFIEYVILKVVHTFPTLTRRILAASQGLMHENFTGISYRALTVGGNDAYGVYLNKTFHDQEYAISIDDIPVALGKILEIFKKFPNIPLLIALRFAKASRAYIGPSYGRDTCYIDVLIFAKSFERWADFVKQIEKELYQLGARPHWGKHNFLSYEILKQNNLYPQLENFRLAKQKYDPGNLFGNAFIDRCIKPIETE